MRYVMGEEVDDDGSWSALVVVFWPLFFPETPQPGKHDSGTGGSARLLKFAQQRSLRADNGDVMSL